MHYQGHLAKFNILRPLMSKRAAEVAYQFTDICLLLGAPHILQSDNGREFTANIITELKLLWPELKLVHGRPHHPQSQGSVERANADIKSIIISWTHENNNTQWSEGLRFVQFKKKRSYHRTIDQSPYSALFGSDPKVGFSSSAIPKEILYTLETEEDLNALPTTETPTNRNDNNQTTPEADTDIETETNTEPETDTNTEPETETNTEPETETNTEPETGKNTATDAHFDIDTNSETEPEIVSDANMDIVQESTDRTVIHDKIVRARKRALSG
jgi:hypothetical protein